MVVARRRNKVNSNTFLILSGVAAESNTGSAMTTFWQTTGVIRG
jgi:hypothetical protein